MKNIENILFNAFFFIFLLMSSIVYSQNAYDTLSMNKDVTDEFIIIQNYQKYISKYFSINKTEYYLSDSIKAVFFTSRKEYPNTRLQMDKNRDVTEIHYAMYNTDSICIHDTFILSNIRIRILNNINYIDYDPLTNHSIKSVVKKMKGSELYSNIDVQSVLNSPSSPIDYGGLSQYYLSAINRLVTNNAVLLPYSVEKLKAYENTKGIVTNEQKSWFRYNIYKKLKKMLS